MTGLLNKINTLIRSRIESFLEEDLRLPGSRERGELLSADRLGANIDQEIVALRRRIDQAITHEENLQTAIDALRQEASDWDIQADNALLQGDEIAARHALEQFKRTEQKAALLEADLAEHRRSTAEFIERVNVLEGLIAEAREQRPSRPPAAGETLDTVLHTTRIEVETLENEAGPSAAALGEARDQDRGTATPAEDDLAVRRARLARHNPEKEE